MLHLSCSYILTLGVFSLLVPLAIIRPSLRTIIMTSEKMHAIVVEKYGDMDHLVAREVPKPGQPEGEDLLVRYVRWQ